jgi:late competence protein required for DNA uptake (superfamily II DNA/RNA helicase)
MKIELTMTELMLIVDMIKNGVERATEPDDNEGSDSYVASDLSDSTKLKCTQCGLTDGVFFSVGRHATAYCEKCYLK